MDCARNIITANFSGGGTSATTAPLWQWDYGQALCITGIEDLPAAFEVHFSTNRTGGVSTVAVGADGQVTIPNVLLTIGKNLNAWIYLSDAQGEGETEYSILIPVRARPMPETYDAEVTGEFDDVVRQVSEYAETAQTAADNAGASASAAAASASEAAASASAAESAKTAAETAQGEAEDAQAAAETAAQTATEKAQQTEQDAAQAASDAGRAESAAQRAEAAQTGAESAKTDAETAAQDAADSASAASASATSAGQAATSAGQSATAAAQIAASIEGDVQIASQKASEAQTAAGQAVTAKEAAQTAQTAAETAETNAGQSASTATTKAAEAAQSASGAAQSKADAEAAANRAEQAAATLTVDSALSDTSVNPVQNKVVTAEFADVKSAINDKVSIDALEYGYQKSYNSQLIWEQGNINSSTGVNSTSTSSLHQYTIRTKGYIDSGATNVIVKNVSQNYRISIYKYDSNDTFVDYTNKQTSLEIDNQYKYRLVLSHYMSSSLSNYLSVSPSEYNEIGIFSDLSIIVTNDELQPIIEKVDNSINKKAYKYGYANDSNNINLWEQGNINRDTGINSASTATIHLYTIRTKGYIDSSIEKVLCSQGYFSIYTYSVDGTFEGYSPYAQEYSGFSSDKKYRINYRTQPSTSGVDEITPEYANNIYFLSSSLVNSPYLKTVSWAKNVPNNWYQGLGNDYSLFEHTTSYDDFISAFTALCSNRNDVTITNIGTSSDNKDMFSYEIVPTLYKGMTSFNRNNKPVKVVIVSGQHGFEKSSCYGLYYFVRDLLNSYLDDPVLTWIKSNVHLIIIPCANPYGFTNMVRKNANGVDLNRNWNPGFDGTISPSSDYYGGASAFDQPETQAIKAVIDANTDAFYLIDFHTNGEYKVANWNIVNWNSFNVSVTTDDYFVNAYRAAFIHVSQLTECFASEYNLDSDGSAMGSITQNTQLSTISTYSRSIGIMSNTFEGMNGFPSDAEPYQPNEQKANSEMICNWIKTLLSIFSNVNTYT